MVETTAGVGVDVVSVYRVHEEPESTGSLILVRLVTPNGARVTLEFTAQAATELATEVLDVVGKALAHDQEVLALLKRAVRELRASEARGGDEVVS